MLLLEGRAAGAVPCYREAVRLRPDHVEAHLRQAPGLTEEGSAGPGRVP